MAQPEPNMRPGNHEPISPPSTPPHIFSIADVAKPHMTIERLETPQALDIAPGVPEKVTDLTYYFDAKRIDTKLKQRIGTFTFNATTGIVMATDTKGVQSIKLPPRTERVSKVYMSQLTRLGSR